LSLPCHGDWDFRIHPGTFDLYLGPVLDALRRFVSGRREYYARNRKRPDGYRSHIDHIAAVDWLEDGQSCEPDRLGRGAGHDLAPGVGAGLL